MASNLYLTVIKLSITFHGDPCIPQEFNNVGRCPIHPKAQRGTDNRLYMVVQGGGTLLLEKGILTETL